MKTDDIIKAMKLLAKDDGILNKEIFAHPQTISSLFEHVQDESYHFPRSGGTVSDESAMLTGFKFRRFLCDITMPMRCPKKQDRRNNHRIQARKKLREKRAGRKPDPNIYLIDMDKLHVQMHDAIMTRIFDPCGRG